MIPIDSSQILWGRLCSSGIQQFADPLCMQCSFPENEEKEWWQLHGDTIEVDRVLENKTRVQNKLMLRATRMQAELHDPTEKGTSSVSPSVRTRLSFVCQETAVASCGHGRQSSTLITGSAAFRRRLRGRTEAVWRQSALQPNTPDNLRTRRLATFFHKSLNLRGARTMSIHAFLSKFGEFPQGCCRLSSMTIRTNRLVL